MPVNRANAWTLMALIGAAILVRTAGAHAGGTAIDEVADTGMSTAAANIRDAEHYYAIVGAVAAPATYSSDQPVVDLRRIIARAGGLTPAGSGSVRIIHHGRQLQQILFSQERALPVPSGAVIVAEFRPDHPRTIGRNGLSFVACQNLLPRPLVLGGSSARMSLDQLLHALRQPSGTGEAVQMIPRAAATASADDTIPDGTALIFAAGTVDQETLDEVLRQWPLQDVRPLQPAAPQGESASQPAGEAATIAGETERPEDIDEDNREIAVESSAPEVPPFDRAALRPPRHGPMTLAAAEEDRRNALPEPTAQDASVERAAVPGPLDDGGPRTVTTRPVLAPPAPPSEPFVLDQPARRERLMTSPVRPADGNRVPRAPSPPADAPSVEPARTSNSRAANETSLIGENSPPASSSRNVSSGDPKPATTGATSSRPLVVSAAVAATLAVIGLLASVLWTRQERRRLGEIPSGISRSLAGETMPALDAAERPLDRLINNELPVVEEEPVLPEGIVFHGRAIGYRYLRHAADPALAGPHFGGTRKAAGRSGERSRSVAETVSKQAGGREDDRRSAAAVTAPAHSSPLERALRETEREGA